MLYYYLNIDIIVAAFTTNSQIKLGLIFLASIISVEMIISCLLTWLIYSDLYPVNRKHLYNICTMSDERRRRLADVVQKLCKYFVFTGY